MQPYSPTPSKGSLQDWIRAIGLISFIGILLTFLSNRYVRLNFVTESDMQGAVSALKANQLPEARKQFDALLASAPNNLQRYLLIIETCKQQKQWNLALEYIRRSLKVADQQDSSSRAMLLSQLVNTLSEAKPANWKTEALQVAEQAYSLQPNDPEMMNLYGYILADLTDDPANLQKAFELLSKALEMAKGRVQDLSGQVLLSAVLDSYGWVLYKKGDYAGAVISLTSALDHLPSDIVQTEGEPPAGKMTGSELKTFYYHLGAAYRKAKKPAEARQRLDQALKFDPTYEEALAERKALDLDPKP